MHLLSLILISSGQWSTWVLQKGLVDSAPLFQTVNKVVQCIRLWNVHQCISVNAAFDFPSLFVSHIKKKCQSWQHHHCRQCRPRVFYQVQKHFLPAGMQVVHTQCDRMEIFFLFLFFFYKVCVVPYPEMFLSASLMCSRYTTLLFSGSSACRRWPPDPRNEWLIIRFESRLPALFGVATPR